MTQEKFLIDYCPDYDKRALDYGNECLIAQYANNPDTRKYSLQRSKELAENMFTDALQAFADKICERQRELCSRAYEYSSEGYGCSAIECAPAPKINEI